MNPNRIAVAGSWALQILQRSSSAPSHLNLKLEGLNIKPNAKVGYDGTLPKSSPAFWASPGPETIFDRQPSATSAVVQPDGKVLIVIELPFDWFASY